jgi:ergothioneine biosynthesis protein EgtB
MYFSTEVNRPGWQAAHAARTADASLLAKLLVESRAHTLALVDAYVAALGEALPVAYSPQLNPPLWELGHTGWFQEYWVDRNPQRALGVTADPLSPRGTSLLEQADILYNSSLVEHRSRWHLELPDLGATRRYLANGLDATLNHLAHAGSDDNALYFYRLALFHEDMHGEAAVYMAQALGIALPAPQVYRRPRRALKAVQSLVLTPGDWLLGYAADTSDGQAMGPAAGFAFDNELGVNRVVVGSCEINDRPVSWRRYLEFVQAGGYADPRWWGPEAWQWLQTRVGNPRAPRYLRPCNGGSAGAVWEHCCFGVWQTLDLDAPACHLSYFEAEAWCRWAGRVLPTEAQWEKAALTLPGFEWGDVWEWTSSTFNPYPGFVAHPYRDYSAPWFGSRPVLRGASVATHARMAHPRYRNYFTPERNDIMAGFRTCSAAG